MTVTRETEVALNWAGRSRCGRPRRSPLPPAPRIPRITRLMALAIKFQEMIDRGEVRDYAELARLGLVTRARLTQIMNLLLLAPRIQETLLCLDTQGQPAVSERDIRRVLQIVHWPKQEFLFRTTSPHKAPSMQ